MKHSGDEDNTINSIDDEEIDDEEDEEIDDEDEEIDDEDEENDDEEIEDEESDDEEIEDEEEDEETEDKTNKDNAEDKKESENKAVKIKKTKKKKIEEINDSMSQKTVGSIRGKKKTYATKLERKKRKIAMLARNRAQKKTEYTAESKAKATQISIDRILTDEDFKRIDMALVKQQVTHAKRGMKRPLEEDRGELVKLGDIENIFKKKRHDKAARLESVKVFILLSILIYLI